MKYLVFICILFASYAGFSQSCPPPPTICFITIKGLEKSESVILTESLIKEENWDSLKMLMASENPALKYLAIEICNYEARKGQVVFDREDQEIIERAKQSGEKIIYKQECKPQRVYSLKELFKNNPSVLNPQLTSWINRIKK